MKKTYLLSGLASPLVYLITVIVGGALYPGYSHSTQAISELTASGAPHQLFLNILFSVSGALGILFALSAYRYVQPFHNKTLKTAMALLIAITVLSFTWPLFPMDPRGADPTLRGIIHLVLAGIVSPLTIAVPVITGLAFRRLHRFRNYALFSLLSAAAILATGLLAVAGTQTGSHNLGIYERLTIGAYYLWMAVSATRFYTGDAPAVPRQS